MVNGSLSWIRSYKSPFWNAIPENTFSVLPCCITLSFKCLRLPTAREKPASITLRVRNTGAMLPGPNGANCFKIRTNLGVIVGKSISMSTLSSGVRSPSSRCSETYFSNLSENSCKCSGFSESPAAYLCPPKCSRMSEHESMAS